MPLWFSWPLPHMPGSKHHFCIQGGSRVGWEQGKATPAGSVSSYQRNESFPEFTQGPKRLLFRSHCPESGHMAILSYGRLWRTELCGLLLQTKLSLCQHGRRDEWILVCQSTQPHCTGEKTETRKSRYSDMDTGDTDFDSKCCASQPVTRIVILCVCSVSIACWTLAKVIGLTTLRNDRVNPSREAEEDSESVCGFLCLRWPAAFWYCSLQCSKGLSGCKRRLAKCRLRTCGRQWAVTPLKTSHYNGT